jgi:hypothetical protein
MNYFWANHIYLANLCVIIKHQKEGDWKSISRVNDILVFVVNTRVINHLFRCEGLLVNARRLSAPQKWKYWSNEDLDFRLCNLGLYTIKRGCSMKSWGEIILVLNTYTPLQFVGENSAEIFMLEIFWAETLALRTEDSGLKRPETLILNQRLRPKNLASQTQFSPEWCKPLDSARSLWGDRPETLSICTWEPETPVLTGWRLWVAPETLAHTDPTRNLRGV